MSLSENYIVYDNNGAIINDSFANDTSHLLNQANVHQMYEDVKEPELRPKSSNKSSSSQLHLPDIQKLSKRIITIKLYREKVC